MVETTTICEGAWHRLRGDLHGTITAALRFAVRRGAVWAAVATVLVAVGRLTGGITVPLQSCAAAVLFAGVGGAVLAALIELSGRELTLEDRCLVIRQTAYRALRTLPFREWAFACQEVRTGLWKVTFTDSGGRREGCLLAAA